LSHIEDAVFMVCRVLVYQTRITAVYMINSTELVFYSFMVSEHTSSPSWSHIIDGIWYTQWPIYFGQYKKCWQNWFYNHPRH